MNGGKLFEEDFRLSCKDNVAVTRLYDTLGGQMGVANICDFIVTYFPYTFYLELKSTSTGTLPLKNISNTQYTGLLEKSKYKGAECGLIIKYAKYDEHYYVPIQEVERLKEEGKKSISYKHIKKGKVSVIEFPSELKRTRFKYDFDEFVRRFRGSEYDNAK